MLDNFDILMATKDSCSLSFDQLEKLLAENSLNIQSEYELFEWVVKWSEYDYEINREEKAVDLMKNVRFPLMSAEELEKVKAVERIASNDGCLKLLNEARIYQENKNEARTYQENQNEAKTYQENQNEARTYQENQNEARTYQENQNEARTSQENQNEARTSQENQNEARAYQENQNEARAYQENQNEARTYQENQTEQSQDKQPQPIRTQTRSGGLHVVLTHKNKMPGIDTATGAHDIDLSDPVYRNQASENQLCVVGHFHVYIRYWKRFRIFLSLSPYIRKME